VQCFPRRSPVKRRPAFHRHAAAESDYYRAIHMLSFAIRSLKKPDGYVLEDFADSARKMVEDSWDALERHTSEHGC
jgi:hypothetical protein